MPPEAVEILLPVVAFVSVACVAYVLTNPFAYQPARQDEK